MSSNESPKENRYQRGKIYKIVNNLDENEFYIGATTEPRLCLRMAQHRKNASRPNCMFRHIYVRMNEIGIDNFSILLVEDYPCENKDKLRAREDVHIKELKPSLNSRREKRSMQEYYLDNIDKYRIRRKEYRKQNYEMIIGKERDYHEKNRIKLYEKHAEKIPCDNCGAEITRGHMCRHKKSSACKRLDDAEKAAVMAKQEICDNCGRHVVKYGLKRHKKSTICLSFTKPK